MRHMLVIAAAAAAFACAAAVAASMTKDEYSAGKKRTLAEYEAARQKCGPHLGNPTQICVARARGERNVARAELEAAYRPTPRNLYRAAAARADVDYEVAKQKCDAEKGAAKKSCMVEARAARERARTEARAATSTPR